MLMSRKMGVSSDRPRPFSRGDSDRQFSKSARCANVPDRPLPFDGGTWLRHFRVRKWWERIVSRAVRHIDGFERTVHPRFGRLAAFAFVPFGSAIGRQV